jgi:hypothetical protein
MSLHVSTRPSSSGTQAGTTSSGTALEPVGISRPSKLELTGPDEDLLINLILEQVCLFCSGGGFMPVTLSETCSSCSASGYEFIDNERLPCPVCDGTCWVPIEEMEQCERCDGTGLELTCAGRRLLRRSGSELWIFLNRWHDWRGGVRAAITDAVGVVEQAAKQNHVEADELPRGQK